MLNIDISDLNELRSWSAALNVSPDRLKQAVLAVGTSPYTVIKYLNKANPVAGGARSERSRKTRASGTPPVAIREKVLQVALAEWTPEEHASLPWFQGMRTDKRPQR